MHHNFICNSFNKINSYTEDQRGAVVSINQSVIDSFGIESVSSLIGRTYTEWLNDDKYAAIWMENGRRIQKTGVAEQLIEIAQCKDRIVYFRSYKTPLLGRSGKTIGLTGFSIPLSSNSLIPISKQQTECLKLLALGNTYRQIANALGLSQKTVEHYIENIKNKLNCECRAELVQQAIERGLIGLF